MNKRQAEVLKQTVQDEQKVIRELKQVYKKARQDCEQRIAELNARTDMQNIQSIVYQKKYQQAIMKQLDDVLKVMEIGQFDTIDEYLHHCYETGFFGTLYDLQGQGIPLAFPINQKDVTRAIQTDSKISEGLYNRLGEDVKHLKTSIRAELSRGIANGSSWDVVAGKIAKGMNSPFNVAFNKAVRIARTEGARIVQESQFEVQKKAKSCGADVVKQWDATFDSKTRPHHMELDGQIKEIDEPFEIDGMKAMHPLGFGIASEDINCRCHSLQRAKWALNMEQTKYLGDVSKMSDDRKKEIAEKLGISPNELGQVSKSIVKLKSDNLKDFVEEVKSITQPFEKTTDFKNREIEKMVSLLDNTGVKYNGIVNHAKELTEEEIIKALSGGDRTHGSCASVGLAYIGQKQGWNVLDFRDGESRKFFSRSTNLYDLAKSKGMVATFYGDVVGKSSCTLANNFLKTCEVGKEYYLCVGRHASIVRKTEEGVLQYLELQSTYDSGWTKFNGNPRYTLTQRFGCSSSGGHGEVWDFMLNITDSDFDNDDFKTLLGYINTAESEQVKGFGGTIK